VIQFAREFASTAEKTGGKCTVIVGSGVNHWYHSNLHYRASIAALMFCGCIGVNGGGLNHYTGQEKLVPAASWSTLAMALDWTAPPRLQNGPSFHYVHSDQWRYEKGPVEAQPSLSLIHICPAIAKSNPYATGHLIRKPLRIGGIRAYRDTPQQLLYVRTTDSLKPVSVSYTHLYPILRVRTNSPPAKGP